MNDSLNSDWKKGSKATLFFWVFDSKKDDFEKTFESKSLPTTEP